VQKRPPSHTAQKQARERLLVILAETGTYADVARRTKINRGRIWKICNRTARASQQDIDRLGIRKAERKPRIPWKKKYLLLRKAITNRRVNP